ncbi:MAG: adenylate/guanylate cyclase domain-containing protein [Nitrososphaeria archaeon]|nr:adenylate/guanylate cyclase domain-containing protein [Nitrososphaeria archaeon]
MLTTKVQQIQVITTNPMIKKLIVELNPIKEQEAFETAVAEKRIDFLIEVQAFEASIGGLNDLENVEIVGIDGHRLFALVNTKAKKDYLADPTFIRGSKESFTYITLGKDNKRNGMYNDYRGYTVLGASSCNKGMGLAVLVEIDDSEVFEPVADLRDKIIVLGVIITVLVGAAAFFLSKLISKPLIKLRNAANQIAGGDFNVRTNIQTADEIGQLSHSFDQMAEKIQDSLLKIKEREDVIKQQKDILLQFSQYSSNYCVCFVDIVGSTKITAKLSDMETSKFYSIFLNTAATTITQNNGVVVKNIGDALLYYFPKTDSDEQEPFLEMLRCCQKLIEARSIINKTLSAENLPEVSYRISAMFGPVRVAIVATSAIDDIFGSTVNTCSKINNLAKPNTLVIGESLYQKVKGVKEFKFEKIADYTIDADNKFAVYIVS